MLMGWLAICGIPIWAGFFSKDEILYKTYSAYGPLGNWAYVLWIVGLITAVLTAIYMTRLMVMTFFGEERFHLALAEHGDAHDASKSEPPALAGGQFVEHSDSVSDAAHDEHDDDDEHHALPKDFHPHESPWNMTVPLIVLAILSTVGGLVGIPYAVSSIFGGGDINVFERTLKPVIYQRAVETHQPVPSLVAPGTEIAETATAAPAAEHAVSETHNAAEVSTERMLAVLSVLLALAGIAIGGLLFLKEPLRKLPKILEEKWRIDEVYNTYIVDPITNLSREGLWKGMDVGFVDGIVNGTGYFIIALGSLLRRIQVGFIRGYAALILLGALVVIGYFIYFGIRLVS
jgi:NADH-quinone oxidoreductase subunit L